MKKLQMRLMTGKELKMVSGCNGCHGIIISGTIVSRSISYPFASTREECKQAACSFDSGNNMYVWGAYAAKCETIKINTNYASKKQSGGVFSFSQDFTMPDNM